MTRRADWVLSVLLGITLWGGAMAVCPPAFAAGVSPSAPQKLFVRENDLTARLRAWSQAIGMDLAQLAMGHNAELVIDDLGARRERFAESLDALRRRAPDAEDRWPTSPEIDRRLAEAEAVWPELDRAIAAAISWGHLTHSEILVAATAAGRLDDALDRLQEAYRAAAIDYGVHSVILNAIQVAEEQRVLSQEIAKTFVLMHYGIAAPQNRARLAAAIEAFDRDMGGLVDGDAGRGLIAAPTPGIRTEIDAARATWSHLRGSLTLEPGGGALDAEAVREVSELSEILYGHLDAAIEGLKAL